MVLLTLSLAFLATLVTFFIAFCATFLAPDLSAFFATLPAFLTPVVLAPPETVPYIRYRHNINNMNIDLILSFLI